jgi:hypothetical protein
METFEHIVSERDECHNDVTLGDLQTGVLENQG